MAEPRRGGQSTNHYMTANSPVNGVAQTNCQWPASAWGRMASRSEHPWAFGNPCAHSLPLCPDDLCSHFAACCGRSYGCHVPGNGAKEKDQKWARTQFISVIRGIPRAACRGAMAFDFDYLLIPGHCIAEPFVPMSLRQKPARNVSTI